MADISIHSTEKCYSLEIDTFNENRACPAFAIFKVFTEQDQIKLFFESLNDIRNFRDRITEKIREV
jgi:hypothetical protein